ncbi:MAG: hypothetical protein ABIP93_13435, partial [Gemmatimonadaceae bacterium]
VRVSHGALIGTLVRSTQDTIVVAPERGGAPLALARAEVASFEVSRGRHSVARAAGTWGTVGALAFGFTFLVAEGGNPCAADLTRTQCVDVSNRAVAKQGAGGAVFGAVLGGAFGALFRRGERWQPALLPVRVALTLPDQQAGRAVGFAVGVRW